MGSLSPDVQRTTLHGYTRLGLATSNTDDRFVVEYILDLVWSLLVWRGTQLFNVA